MSEEDRESKNKKRNFKTEQISPYPNKEEPDRIGEINEVCNLIHDDDVKICAKMVFKLADETVGRKLASVEVFDRIMIYYFLNFL